MGEGAPKTLLSCTFTLKRLPTTNLKNPAPVQSRTLEDEQKPGRWTGQKGLNKGEQTAPQHGTWLREGPAAPYPGPLESHGLRVSLIVKKEQPCTAEKPGRHPFTRDPALWCTEGPASPAL